MKYKTIAIVLITVIVTGLTSSYTTYKATINSALETNQQSIDGLRPALVEAIKKETTAIKNEIELKVDKIKKSDELVIDVKQDPESTITQKLKDSNCIPEGYVLLKIEKLTRRQKRRLNLQ